ncbi:ABC transporter substrate-binding protein [Psychrobacillus antarcticus]|uniref:ABC transporter substrate-binding protein n=1 Tax=Psychrobacillus antarcticus TaxID=2879115 RepID=UPI002407B6FE|nr:sugar ABC transporter substrate-binding protein [Psychrobacillus antarcticus]
MLRKIMAFTLITFLLVGCSTSETNNSDSKTEEQITLNVLMEEVPDTDIAIEMVKSFNQENENIVLNIETLPYDQMRDKLVSSFLAPEAAYDIIVVDNPWMYDFSNAGYLEPLDDKIETSGSDYDFSDFSDSLEDIAIVNDQKFAIPFYNYATGLVYRKDVFEEQGISIPTTLKELCTVAQTLTTDEAYGIAAQPQKGYKIMEEWMNWLLAAGGALQNDNGDIILDSPEAREALKAYIDTINSSAPKNSTNWAFDEALRSVASGDSMMTLNYNWMLPTLNNPDGEAGSLAGNFALAEVPGGQAALGAWFWAISSNSEYKDEAWTFIEWISSPEQEKSRVISGGAPVRDSILDDPEVWEQGYGEEYYVTLKNILADAIPLANGPNAEELIQVVGTELNAAVTGQKTVDEAITDASNLAKEIMNE